MIPTPHPLGGRRTGPAGALLVLALLAACETTTWRTPSGIKPVTYTPVADAPDAGVGKLRRLAVVSAGFEYHGPGGIGAGLAQGATDAAGRQATLERLLVDATIEIVGGRQAYEVTEASAETAGDGLPPGAWDAHVETLAAWAGRAVDGERAPPETVAAVQALSAACGTDGILLVRGYGNMDNDAAFMATLLTASLLWPVLLAEERLALGADILQASDGQPVWRARYSSNVLGEIAQDADVDNRIRGLYADLAPALPAILEAETDADAPPASR